MGHDAFHIIVQSKLSARNSIAPHNNVTDPLCDGPDVMSSTEQCCSPLDPLCDGPDVMLQSHSPLGVCV